MKKLALVTTLFIFIAGVSMFAYFNVWNTSLLSPVADKASELVEKPLEKYSFPRLKTTNFNPSPITIGKTIQETDQVTSRMFYYSVNGYKVSGMLNTPAKEGTYPVIVMFRGFVPRESFSTGEGTRRSSEVFAQNGFITVAPDFLGFGESDVPQVSSMEDRFLTYPTALTLLSSIDSLSQALRATDSARISVDTQKVGVWGHSNGGHIALSALAITGKPYPTVLWNPVTKSFPYSILYFMDEAEDNGKALRKVVADFEKDYDIELYSPSNYYSSITAPIQLHQGADDEAVPLKWTNQFEEAMSKEEKDIEYYVYPGDDHNFSKGSWSTVVARNIQFYKEHFSKK